jgi:hypothetical protein
MTKDEALKLALEALEWINRVNAMDYEYQQKAREALNAIKEALAQTQEPVAWGVFDDNLHDMFFAKEEAHEMVRLKGDGSTVKPLYTTPPQRKPLTDEDIWEAYMESHVELDCSTDELYALSRTVEAKLKDKNTGG